MNHHTGFLSWQVDYVCLFNCTKKYSAKCFSSATFFKSSHKVKSAKTEGKKANCTKKLTKEIHLQTAQITSPEINFKMQLALYDMGPLTIIRWPL